MSRNKKKKHSQPKPSKPKNLSEMMAMPEEELIMEMPVMPVITEPVLEQNPEMYDKATSDISPLPEVATLPESPPDEVESGVEPDPYIAGIRAEVEEVAQELGIEPTPPPVEPELMDEDPLPRDIRTYCTVHSISLILKALCEEVPEAMPNYRTWRCPDPIPTIYEKIQSLDYVESLLGPLDIMMGDNVKNTQWAARVVIAIATYDVVREL